MKTIIEGGKYIPHTTSCNVCWTKFSYYFVDVDWAIRIDNANAYGTVTCPECGASMYHNEIDSKDRVDKLQEFRKKNGWIE